jgi:pimeloyl-ACP methyl ester carboxylesterase
MENSSDDAERSAAEYSLNRRELMHTAAALLTTSVMAREAIAEGLVSPSEGQAHAVKPLDIAAYSWAWVGVQRLSLPRGTTVDGGHLYVEYQVPAEVKHPYPVVLIHGGHGQGLDWMGTPDGRRGWMSYLLEEGYQVYVVDRPGQGRPVYHPGLHNLFRDLPTYEGLASTVSALAKTAGAHPQATLHSQWPGTGQIGDPALDQFIASLGPAFPESLGPFVAVPTAAHETWRHRGAALLDLIGPAILMTHSDSSILAWLVADERPKLVKGIIAIEPAGPPFQALRWGVTNTPVAYDPPVASLEELGVTAPIEQAGAMPYRLQTEPARRLKNLVDIPIVVVTAEASAANLRDPAIVAFLKQGGCRAEQLQLAEHGVHGNGPYLMLEKNNREALQPILAWMERSIPKPGIPVRAPPVPPSDDSTAMKLADQGFFWSGVQRKRMPYGTIASGQLFVQYYIPQQVRYPYPIVLIHGGGGQSTHMMGIGGRPGWVHFFVQEGYRVYNVDRPAWGRSPYHPDAFDAGHLGLFEDYEALLNVFHTRQWPGTGDIGDPLVDQFVPNEIGAPLRWRGLEEAVDNDYFVTAGMALLDKIGPAILLTHAFSGQLGWTLADRRPSLVKGIVTMEPNGAPFEGQLAWGLTAVPVAYDPPVRSPEGLSLVEYPATAKGPVYKLQRDPARRLKNLRDIPIGWITGELREKLPNNYGFANGPASVAFLKQAGCHVDHMLLTEYGVSGNGNLMLLEMNNKQVFGVIRDWLVKSVAAPNVGG